MKLRTHLLFLATATLLPMIVLAVLGAGFFAQRERKVFQRGATERTLALLNGSRRRAERLYNRAGGAIHAPPYRQ